jgi:hypothetical protein
MKHWGKLWIAASETAEKGGCFTLALLWLLVV